MQNINFHLFHLNENLYSIETSTPKITHPNGRAYDCWFFNDFYSSFTRIVPEVNINKSELLLTLKSCDKYIVTEDSLQSKIIISPKSTYDENTVNTIMNRTPKNSNPYEDDDSFDDISVRCYATNKSNKKPNNNRNDRNNKRNDKKDTFNTGRNIHNKSKSANENNTYEENRQMILDALKYASAFPIVCFQNMMINAHGCAFDFKFAEANRIKGCRAKLSKYLDDCNDILEKVILNGKLFYIKSKIYGDLLVKKRKNAHCRNLTINSTFEDKYHLEILLTNMFPLKITLSLHELDSLFEKVYGATFLSVSNMLLMKFLKMIKSPNLNLYGDFNNAKITLTPTFDDNHRMYGDEDAINNVLRIEKNILDDKIDDEFNTAKSCVTNELDEMYIPFKFTDIFETNDNRMISLLDRAGHNIPRSMQKIINISDNQFVFDKCKGEGFGLDDTFFLIHQSLMLNESVID